MIPIAAELLEPRVIKETKRQQARVKKQAKYYNVRAKSVPPFKVGDVLRMKTDHLRDKKWKKAIVKERLDFQSYLISVDGQIYRRKRADLRRTEETPENTKNVHWPSSSTKKADGIAENPDRKSES